MIKNSKKYNKLAEKERGRQLRKLTMKQGIQRLEEILSLRDSMPPQRVKQPLPVSLNRLLDPKYRKKT